MTRSGIEPRPPTPRADALTTMLCGGSFNAVGGSVAIAACCQSLGVGAVKMVLFKTSLVLVHSPHASNWSITWMREAANQPCALRADS